MKLEHKQEDLNINTTVLDTRCLDYSCSSSAVFIRQIHAKETDRQTGAAFSAPLRDVITV